MEELGIQLQPKQEEAWRKIFNKPELLYGGARGGGKRISCDTNVFTNNGWKRAGDVLVSDKLLSMDGTFCNILSISEVKVGDMYRILFNDQVSIDCDIDHNWLVKSQKHGHRDGWIVRTTGDLLESKDKWTIPLIEGFAPGKVWNGVDPYIVGYILGNGSMTGKYTTIYVSSKDREIVRYLHESGWNCYHYEYGRHKNVDMCQYTKEDYRELIGRNVGDEKKIPTDLLYAEPKARIALLQGLMDSDGSCDKDGSCSYSSVSKVLMDQIQYLVRSLGGKFTYRKVVKKSSYNGRGWYYDSSLSHLGKFEPFRLQRKLNRINRKQTGDYRGIKSICKVKDAEAVCFAVDHPSHTFVIKDFVVTHNSYLVRAWQLGRRIKYPHTTGVIIRKTYDELNQNHIQQMWKEHPQLHEYYLKSEKTLEFPNGSRLLFRHLAHPDDVYNFIGSEFEDIALDQAEQHSEETIKLLRASNRTTNRNISPKMLLTANPGGPGHLYLKRLFIEKKFVDGEDPDDYDFVSAKVWDNKFLVDNNPEYVKALQALPEQKRRAWLDGDWDVFEGQAFGMWRDDIHFIDPLFSLHKVPENYKLFAGWDEGTLAPRAFGVFVQDNNGMVQMIYEYYVKNETIDVASRNIKERLEENGLLSPMQDRGKIYYDPSMNIKSNQTGRSSVDIARNILGIRFEAGNNNREEGFRRMQTMLNWTEEYPIPIFRVWNTCTEFKRTIPALTYASNGREDIDTNEEDHHYDEARYALMSLVKLPDRLSKSEDPYKYANQPPEWWNKMIDRKKKKRSGILQNV